MALNADFVHSIRNMKDLCKLSLCNCDINCECAHAWQDAPAALSHATSLSLRNCRVTGEGAWQACLRGIAGATGLQELTVVKQV